MFLDKRVFMFEEWVLPKKKRRGPNITIYYAAVIQKSTSAPDRGQFCGADFKFELKKSSMDTC